MTMEQRSPERIADDIWQFLISGYSPWVHDAQHRHAATLAELGEEHIELIISFVETPGARPIAKVAALSALGRMGGERAVEVCAEQLHRASKKSWPGAFHALAMMGEQAREPLEAYTRSRKKKAKQRAQALLEVLDRDEFEPLRRLRVERDAISPEARDSFFPQQRDNAPYFCPLEYRDTASKELINARLAEHGVPGFAAALRHAIELPFNQTFMHRIDYFCRVMSETPGAVWAIGLLCWEHHMPLANLSYQPIDRNNLMLFGNLVFGEEEMSALDPLFALMPPGRARENKVYRR